MAEIFPDCETKKLQEFIENVANVNTKKSSDIISFEAKEIDVNLKRFLSRKE